MRGSKGGYLRSHAAEEHEGAGAIVEAQQPAVSRLHLLVTGLALEEGGVHLHPMAGNVQY